MSCVERESSIKPNLTRKEEGISHDDDDDMRWTDGADTCLLTFYYNRVGVCVGSARIGLFVTCALLRG